ncbi:hypothetical protein N2152v2_010869 [Parachlorella kessleri]
MVEAAGGATLVQGAFLLIQASVQGKEGAETAMSFLGKLGTWLHGSPGALGQARIFTRVVATGAFHDFVDWLNTGLGQETAVGTSAFHNAVAVAFHEMLHSGAKFLANWVEYEESCGLGFMNAALTSELAGLRAELRTARQATSTLEQRACANPRCATLRGAGEGQLDTLRCARCKHAF